VLELLTVRLERELDKLEALEEDISSIDTTSMSPLTHGTASVVVVNFNVEGVQALAAT